MRHIAYAAALMVAFGVHGAVAADNQPVAPKTESEPIAIQTLPPVSVVSPISVEDVNALVDSANFIVHVGDEGICSGTLLEPVKYRLILTAWHCIEWAISNVEKDVNEDGEVKKKTFEVFQDVKVEQKLYTDKEQVGGSSYVTSIVAYDKIHDLGLLQIKAEKIPQSIGVQVFDKRFGTVSRGDAVWAMGNPLGLDAAVSFGHITSTHRFFKTMDGDQVAYYQTDAMVTFGNSGGALMKGKYLIGVPDKVAPGTTVALHIPYTFVQAMLTKNCYEDVWSDKPAKSYDDCEAAKKAKAEDKTSVKDLLKQFLEKQQEKK